MALNSKRANRFFPCWFFFYRTLNAIDPYYSNYKKHVCTDACLIFSHFFFLLFCNSRILRHSNSDRTNAREYVKLGAVCWMVFVSVPHFPTPFGCTQQIFIGRYKKLNVIYIIRLTSMNRTGSCVWSLFSPHRLLCSCHSQAVCSGCMLSLISLYAVPDSLSVGFCWISIVLAM